MPFVDVWLLCQGPPTELLIPPEDDPVEHILSDPLEDAETMPKYHLKVWQLPGEKVPDKIEYYANGVLNLALKSNRVPNEKPSRMNPGVKIPLPLGTVVRCLSESSDPEPRGSLAEAMKRRRAKAPNEAE